MDYMRSCYRSQMRLFHDRLDVLVEGAWHWCQPGAKLLPFPIVFTSGTWDPREDARPTGVGEVSGKRPYSKGRPDPARKGHTYCGDAGVWRHGIAYAERHDQLYHANGTPCLCPGLCLYGGVGIDGEPEVEIVVPPVQDGTIAFGGEPDVPQQHGSVTFTMSGSWIVPVGVSSIVVECWGGSEGGGDPSPGEALGGSGGGAYALGSMFVSAGDAVTVEIHDLTTWASITGVAPADSSEGALAAGGAIGQFDRGGFGGVAGDSVGAPVNDGADGGIPSADAGGGGGGGGTQSGPGTLGGDAVGSSPGLGGAGQDGFGGGGGGPGSPGAAPTGVGSGPGGSGDGGGPGADGVTGVVVITF